MCADPHDTVLVEVAGRVLTHVRYVGGEFLHSALGFAHLGEVLVHVYGCKDVPTHHLLRKDDCVFVVVTLPRHEGNHQVPSERKLAALGGISLGEDLSGLYGIALAHYRLEGYGRALVGPPVDWEMVYGDVRLEADVSFVVSPVVLDVYFVCIDIDYLALPFGHYLGPGVYADGLLEAGTHDRGFWAEERNRLAHHVRTHEGTVCVVVLEERNEGSCD